MAGSKARQTLRPSALALYMAISTFFQQVFGIVTIVGMEHEADTGADDDVLAGDGEGLLQGPEQGLGRFDGLLISRADPPAGSRIRHPRDARSRPFLRSMPPSLSPTEQISASPAWWPSASLTVLEAIDIEHQQGEHAVAAAGTGEFA